jgi:hypothetical protein
MAHDQTYALIPDASLIAVTAWLLSCRVPTLFAGRLNAA